MKLKKFSAGLLIALMSGGLSAGVAFADNVVDVIALPNTDTIVEGGSTTVGYKIQAVSGGADTENGCNASDGTAATVTIVTPSGVTATPSSLVFTACTSGGSGSNTQDVVFSSSVAGDYNITTLASDSGGGTYVTSGSAFTLHVTAAPVADTTNPVITVPADITGVEATSPAGASVTFSVTATDNVTANPTISCSTTSGVVVSGATFPLGATLVTCTATDAANNTADGTFTVTVVDTTAPSIPTNESPVDNTFTTTAGQQLINWSDSTDVGNVSTPVTYAYEASNSADVNGVGGEFTSPIYGPASLSDSQISTTGTPDGVYYWHVKAIDASGNSSAWSTPWKITVDNIAPVVTILSPTTASYALNETVTADYNCTDDNSGIADVNGCVGDVADGATLDTSSVGQKTFTVTATDRSGNVTSQVVHYSVGYNPDSFMLGSPVSLSSKEYKSKSTIPVKFTIMDWNTPAQPYALAQATLELCKESGLTCNPVGVIASGNSNIGNAFRYDASAGQYIYNLSTKTPLTAGSYDLKITIDGNPPLVKTKMIVIK